jgi:hypothetical protein
MLVESVRKMSRKKSKNVVPLRSVSLFKHGVGFFERSGKFKGPGEIELVCASSQMGAMLKSLQVTSEGGRNIAAINFETTKPIDVQVSEFGLELKGCKNLLDLIAKLKGTPVTVDVAGETISGRVLGSNESVQILEDKTFVEQQLVIYTDEKNVRWLALPSVKHMAINDQGLAEEIQTQLELLLQTSRKKDRQFVRVRIADEDEHTLTISYAIPSPAWKASYRLTLNGGTELSIQGSALVENWQDDDWVDVKLKLLSAAPMGDTRGSHQWLGNAGHQSSPTPSLKLERANAATSDSTTAQSSPALQTASTAQLEEGKAEAAPSRNGQEGELLLSKNDGSEQTTDLFKFEIEAPVTVPRNGSALVPFLDKSIEGGALSIYDGSSNHEFPSAVVRLRNDTGLTLPAGPLTIFDSNTYAGEAWLDALKPDDARSINYAMDLSVRATVQREQSCTPIWRVRAWHGHLYFDFKEQNTKTYNLQNLADSKKVVFIDHPFQPLQTYLGNDTPIETTDTYYRFRLELPPSGTASLVVPDEKESATDVWLENFESVELPELSWALGQNYSDVNFSTFLEQVTKRRRVILTMQQMERSMREQVMQNQYDYQRARESVRASGNSGEFERRALEELEVRVTRAQGELSNLVSEIAERCKVFSAFTAVELSAEVVQPTPVTT